MTGMDNTTFRYTPEPGTTHDPQFCGVCGTEMPVRRNVLGHWSYAEAVGNSPKTYRDVYECPHHKDDWHRQVLELRREANRTVSHTLAAIFLKDAEEVLARRVATKPISVLLGNC